LIFIIRKTMFITNYRFIVSLLSLFCLSVSIFANDKVLGISSGLIEYSIEGKGVLTEESNLSIEGKASFYFDNWGILNVEKEEGIFLVSGAIKHKQEIRRLEKQTAKKIIIVDYQNEQLLERKKSLIFNARKALTKGLKEAGEEKILGYTCQVWVGKGIKKYIYKGILLRKEVEIFGISYIKMVKELVFDINISKDTFLLPEYPRHKIGLLKENIKTQNAMKVEDFCTRIKDIRMLKKENLDTVKKINFTDKERQVFINDIGKDTFNRQKEILPTFLVLLKETRFCLQTAKNLFEANYCIEEFSRFRENFGTHVDDYIVVWNAGIKEDFLEKIEENILFLESRIVCVNRANNLIDLSTCMK